MAFSACRNSPPITYAMELVTLPVSDPAHQEMAQMKGGVVANKIHIFIMLPPHSTMEIWMRTYIDYETEIAHAFSAGNALF